MKNLQLKTFFRINNLINNFDENVLNFILVNDGSTDKTKEKIEKFFRFSKFEHLLTIVEI